MFGLAWLKQPEEPCPAISRLCTEFQNCRVDRNLFRQAFSVPQPACASSGNVRSVACIDQHATGPRPAMASSLCCSAEEAARADGDCWMLTHISFSCLLLPAACCVAMRQQSTVLIFGTLPPSTAEDVHPGSVWQRILLVRALGTNRVFSWNSPAFLADVTCGGRSYADSRL